MFDQSLSVLSTLLALPDSIYFCGASGILLLILFIQHSRSSRGRQGACAADWLLLAYVLLQVWLTFTATSPSNAVHFLVPLVSSFCWYYIIRVILQLRLTTSIILRVLTVIGVCLALANLVLQFQGLHQMKIFPGSAIASLRASIPFVGGPTKNDALMVLFLLLSFASATWITEEQVKSKFVWVSRIAIALLVSSLLMSFSRSIYIAVVVFVGISVTIFFKEKIGLPRSAYLSVVGMLLGCAGIVIWYGAGGAAVQTLSLVHTASQQRSTVGRLAIWSARMSLVEAHPWKGWGWLSDGMVTLATIGKSPEAAFTARAYNAPLEVLLSGGIISLILLCLFIFYTLKSLHFIGNNSSKSSSHRSIIIILGAGLIAALVRDMTYTSLVLEGTCIFLLMIGCSMINSSSNRPAPIHEISPKNFIFDRMSLVALLAIMICLTTTMFGASLQRVESMYIEGSMSLRENDLDGAIQHLTDADQGPWKNAIFFSSAALARARLVLPSNIALSKELPYPNVEQKQLLNISAQDYQNAIRYSPDDPNHWCNLGWVDSFLHNDGAAGSAFHHAIEVDPYDYISHLSLGLFYERQGNEGSARDEYGRALSLFPRMIHSSFWADLKSRQLSLANQSMKAAIALLHSQPQSPITNARLAVLDEANGQANTAQSEYAKAVAELPNLPYPWIGLAKLDIANGHEGDARVELQRALVIDPSNTSAKFEMAGLLQRGGDISGANGLYGQILYVSPHSGHSERAGRIYHESVSDPDDVLPPGFLEFTEPIFTPLHLCDDSILSKGATSSANEFVSRRHKQQQEVCQQH